ncbi:MAG: site-specific DNA-methyltransferase [Dolichospermum sp.]|nr:site-specific DNA-methyltransferase [Dolichospermum sp.]
MHGDCLERMKEIPDKSVDMVLTDPPYGTTACKWDSVIPFDLMWSELRRIIKNDKSAVLLFGAEPFSSFLRTSNIEWFKYDWLWMKDQSAQFMASKHKPMARHEIVSVFSAGTTANKSNRRMNYNPQGLKEINKVVKTRKYKDGSTKNDHNWNRHCNNEFVTRQFTGYPYQDIKFIKDKKQALHPTQKPVALLEYLIKTYTLEGETVLDFTMGSGSTGVACKNLNRNFIGIERDDKYFEIAKNRIGTP